MLGGKSLKKFKVTHEHCSNEEENRAEKIVDARTEATAWNNSHPDATQRDAPGTRTVSTHRQQDDTGLGIQRVGQGGS